MVEFLSILERLTALLFVDYSSKSIIVAIAVIIVVLIIVSTVVRIIKRNIISITVCFMLFGILALVSVALLPPSVSVTLRILLAGALSVMITVCIRLVLNFIGNAFNTSIEKIYQDNARNLK